MHHAPVAVGHYFDSPFTADVRSQLKSLLLHGEGRVEALFAGHNHYEGRAEIAGVPIYVSPSTACQYALNPTTTTDESSPRGEWMVASAAADHTHPPGIDPQAPVHDPRNPLMVPGYRVIEGGRGALETHCVWVPQAAAVGVAASL